jgi:predicted nucleic acid-binding protein
VIIDTGILYALADRTDRFHHSARELLGSRETRIVPEPVAVEADWLILENLGVEVEAAFLRSLTEGTLEVECPTMEDRARAAELVEQYHDLKIGYVDAVTVAIAERLGETRIATVDRRHFTAIVPRHAVAFDIVP